MKLPVEIRPPDELETGDLPSLFLAGGVTGPNDWRQTMISYLADFPGVIFNPHVAEWPTEAEALQNQIQWEARYLRETTLRAFWFTPESSCPITQFELGYALGQQLSLLVGAHPDYMHRDNLRIQCCLKKPNIKIADSLRELALQVLDSDRFVSTEG